MGRDRPYLPPTPLAPKAGCFKQVRSSACPSRAVSQFACQTARGAGIVQHALPVSQATQQAPFDAFFRKLRFVNRLRKEALLARQLHSQFPNLDVVRCEPLKRVAERSLRMSFDGATMKRWIFHLVAITMATSVFPVLGARDFRKCEVAPGTKTSKPATAQPITNHPEVRLNAWTAVFLNGKPCPYDAIPADAIITYAEVAEDGQTLVLIRFRSAR